MARPKSKPIEAAEIEIEVPQAAPITHAKKHVLVLDFLEEFRKATINIVFAGIMGLLVLTLFRVINADELAVDPVSLPKAIKDLGYTEEGVALSLSDNMFKIFNAVQLAQHEFNVKAKIEETDFAVPVAGLSFTSVIRLVRQLAGFPQRHISSEIICPHDPCTPANMELHIRFMDGLNPPHVLEPIKAASAEELLTKGAEELLKIADPMSLAVYLYGEGNKNASRRNEALEIAYGAVSQSGLIKATAFNLLGAAILDDPNSTDEDITKAVGYFVLATQADETYYPAFANLAAGMRRKNNPESAIENYKLAIKIKYADSELHQKLGDTYFLNNNSDESLKEFEIANKLSPNRAITTNAIGAVYFQKGDYAKTIEYANKAIELDATFALSYYNLGFALKQTGKISEAKTAFEKYIKLETDPRARAAIEMELKELQ